MQRYLAFLAGINVGGHRVTGPELVAAFTALGFEGATTFLASGNVVFAADEPPAAVRTRIEEHLQDTLGYAVPTYLRPAERVRHIAAHQPFSEEQVAATRGKLQVGLLADAPDGEAADAVAALSTEADRLALDDTELYWLPSGGISDSALDLKALYTATGPMTVRTANTVRRIAAKFL